MYSNIIIFTVFFIILTNRSQLNTFLKLIIGSKIRSSLINDPWIKNLVREKTGLKLLNITIFHDKKMYGMMAGLPFWPKMILSEGLYNRLNKDELEWVILHEAGHCVLWHNLKSLLIEMSMLGLGILLIAVFELNLVMALCLSISLSVIGIQLIRWLTEYPADKFSISRVENPEGVISAQAKFRCGYNDMFNNEKSILRLLFHWNIYPELRIKMAKTRLTKM